MKNVKGFLIPAVVVIAGISAAFGTTAANKSTVLETGYYFNASASPIKCIATPVQCEVGEGPVCTWTDANNVTHNLKRRVSDVMCGISLRRVE